ncbi:AAA family ATPase [Niveibacterium sp. SC-1]|uniref:AAA family ATPase n=1 Tax=Niveibacterium sp. SC-1 TaxID=3135646 RepID=UPI00311F3048
MFHIREIELVHWDFWRRFTVPLDAQIITIVGPNGSGKTTLLDALRTLFALRCSGKREFRRYVRRANAGVAWIRATVANRPGNTGKRPFFPCLKDDVTLACRIKRAGGDWTREYTIEDGVLTIEELDERAQWAGLRDYQTRLAYAGLTPAIAKVLALEQGDTDKLCEYSPRALLDLVFDVFGDKEVLDNYQLARNEQQTALHEIESLALDLEKLRAQAEARRLEADRYLEWRDLNREVQSLEAEIVPRLEVSELQRETREARGKLAAARIETRERHATLASAGNRLAELDEERQLARAGIKTVQAQLAETEQQWLAAHDRLRDLEKLLNERDALRERVGREHGSEALASEEEAAAAFEAANASRAAVRSLKARFEEVTEQLRQARDKAGPPQEAEVRRFRELLRDEKIAHVTLAEIVEITDPAWQPAVEAILRPYRSLILLEDEGDRHIAWALGERERFRHFLVADRSATPTAARGSLLEVTRFAGDPPRWLADLLNRIQRVENAETARDLGRDQDWITRDGYHRERRGARHLGVPHEFWFGALARESRVQALQDEVTSLDAQLKTAQGKQDEADGRLRASREKLLGLQAAELLLARSPEFEAAAAELPEARAQLKQTETTRETGRAELHRLEENLRGVEIEANRRGTEDRSAREALVRLTNDAKPQRLEQAARLLRLRSKRRGMPRKWLAAEALEGLAEQFGGLSGARNELSRLKRRLADGDWATDDQVLIVRDKLRLELETRERDYGSRTAYAERTKSLVDDARGAYIAKLRATVRQYGKNLRALGELSGVHVECPPPLLENEDVALAQAGLEVQFDFDQKGIQTLNDGEASGGQQVMKSLILLVALLMDEARPGGFVFIDEPFAHLDVANIDRVGAFLRATRAQYLITTPVTHNANVFQPAQLTLVTRKKKGGDDWAPPIGVLRRELS